MRRHIETIVADGISRFAQDYLGRRPNHIDTHFLGDMLVIRLRGVLAVVEQQLANNAAAEQGRDLVKRVRAKLIETTRPVLERIVEQATGSKVVSLHHDVSTVTGDEVVVFTLAEAPAVPGEVKPK
jgi:uncharacterized protein YbcI